MILNLTLILAQSEDFSYGSFFFWCLFAIALLVGGFFAVKWVRRWAKEDDSLAAGAIGFTLSDLRQLHKAGQMTDEEFERAKTKMVAATKAAIERKATAAADTQASRARRLDGLL